MILVIGHMALDPHLCAVACRAATSHACTIHTYKNRMSKHHQFLSSSFSSSSVAGKWLSQKK